MPTLCFSSQPALHGDTLWFSVSQGGHAYSTGSGSDTKQSLPFSSEVWLSSQHQPLAAN